MDLKERCSETEDLIHVPQDVLQWCAVVNTIMYFRVP